MHDNKPVTKKFELSKTDFDFISEVYKNIDNIFTNLNITKKILPLSSILSAIGDYRIVNKILKKKNQIYLKLGRDGLSRCVFNKRWTQLLLNGQHTSFFYLAKYSL